MMISSNIFSSITDTQGDEPRIIKNVILINDLHTEHYSKVIFKINDEFWIFSCNPDYDEICLDINLEFPIESSTSRKFLDELINFSIGNIWAIISEKNYTDGIYLYIYDPSIVNASKFIGIFTMIGIGGGLVYELNKSKIYEYLI